MKNISEKLCKMLGVEPKEYYRPDDEIYWANKMESTRDFELIYPDLTESNNFEKLKNIFNEWSTPYKFILKGELYNGVQTDYWAHKSKDNYINWLSYNLKLIMPSLLDKVKQQAQSVDWKY